KGVRFLPDALLVLALGLGHGPRATEPLILAPSTEPMRSSKNRKTYLGNSCRVAFPGLFLGSASNRSISGTDSAVNRVSLTPSPQAVGSQSLP
ncbi:MAG: hypothetical protein AAF199_05230, partial [Pseudomonadota bacterium]